MDSGEIQFVLPHDALSDPFLVPILLRVAQRVGSTLLTIIQFLFDPFNIVALIEASSFQACSDGSAVALEGTYGWVLCAEDGTRLAHGAGFIDRHDPRSFRAEGQGMLSIVCLLRRLYEWCGCTSSFTGVLATDNTGLIDRVQAQGKLKYAIPNSVFQPDWDVVQAIVNTQKQFPITSTYTHVKGHQDEDNSGSIKFTFATQCGGR